MNDMYSSFDSSETQQLINNKTRRECILARRALAVMAFFGLFNNCALHMGLEAGMWSMTNQTQDDLDISPDRCSESDRGNATNKHHEGEFDWDAHTQGLLIGSFFYGYIMTQIPGGWLASRVGGKTVFGLAILLAALLNLMTPFVARFNLYALVAIRVLKGICEGVVYPAVHSMWGYWSPKEERTRWTTVTYAGSMAGGAATWAVGGLLAHSDFLGGWPCIFYVFGTAPLVWFIVWMFLTHNTPAEHPRISKEEREYIEESVGKREAMPIPWRYILRSANVWAICLAQFCGFWMFYTMIIGLPVYLKSIHRIDVGETGWYSAIPYLVLAITTMLVGHLADYIQEKEYLSTTNTRKMMTIIGLIVPASLLIGLGYVGCATWLAVTLPIVSMSFFGFVYGGFFVNHLDIAPRLAGVLMGMSSFMGTIPAIAVPAFMNYLLDFSKSISSWQTIFLVNGCVCMFGCAIFNTFCTGVEQTWGRPPRQETDRERRNRRVDNWFVDSTDLR